MRALGVSKATRCEFARTRKSSCRCRCRGNLHGAARVKQVSDLPFSDPHHPFKKHGEMEQLPMPLDAASKQKIREAAAQDGLPDPFTEEDR